MWGCHFSCRREHEFWWVLSEVLGVDLRERQRRTLEIKGELARVKAKLRKSSLCVVWLVSFGDLFKCRKTSSIALLVWRLVAWVSRQAEGSQTSDSGYSTRRTPGGREGSTRQNGEAEGLESGWRLAARDGCARQWRIVRRLAVGWSPPGGDGAVRILLALGARRCVMLIRQSGPRFRLAAWNARQAFLEQRWCARKGFYTTLGDVLDARLWLGPQLRVQLVLG